MTNQSWRFGFINWIGLFFVWENIHYFYSIRSSFSTFRPCIFSFFWSRSLFLANDSIFHYVDLLTNIFEILLFLVQQCSPVDIWIRLFSILSRNQTTSFTAFHITIARTLFTISKARSHRWLAWHDGLNIGCLVERNGSFFGFWLVRAFIFLLSLLILRAAAISRLKWYMTRMRSVYIWKHSCSLTSSVAYALMDSKLTGFLRWSSRLTETCVIVIF